MEIKDYKKLIDKATTKFSKKYNKVVDLAIHRQVSLGIK